MRVLPLLALLLPVAAASQTRLVEILNADRVDVASDSAGTVRTLTGNVRLRQDTTFLRSRRAVYFETQGLVEMEGAVRIISGRDTLTASTVTYNSNTKTSAAVGNVRLGDGESVLRAPTVTYDSRAEVSAFTGGGRIEHQGAVLTSPTGTYSSARRFAEFAGPVTLVDSTGVLTADRGTYDARVRRADFAGSVHLERPDLVLDADSVVYFRRTERGRAFGRVVLERIGDGEPERIASAPADSSRRTFLFGETVVFDAQAETASARGETPTEGRPGRDPLLLALRADSTGRVDSTLVRAPRIDAARLAVGTDTLDVITAGGGARLWERRLASVADSARFVRRPATDSTASVDRILLLGPRPTAWADGAQLTGDSLAIVAQDETADAVRVWGQAFAARLDSTLGRLQQIAGRQMEGRFDGDALRQLAVWPNAQAIYYRASPEGLLAGADEVSADSIAFRFEGNDVREVAVFRGVEGIIYGAQIVPDRTRLPGFAYDPEGAPTRSELLGNAWEAGWLDIFGPSPEDLRPPATAPPADADPPASEETPSEVPVDADAPTAAPADADTPADPTVRPPDR